MVVETSAPQPGVTESQQDSGDKRVPTDLGIANPPGDLELGQQQLADGKFDAQKVAEQAVAAGGSRDPALTKNEQAQDQEIRRNEVESAAFTIVKAEAVQAYRRGLKGDLENPAERALGRLGKFLASSTVRIPHTGEPLLKTEVDGKYEGGVLEKNHPLPRLKESSEPGQWTTAYDQRATDDDIEPSAIGSGVVQLDTFTGKTADGAYHFLGTDATNRANGKEIVLSENDFVKAFMLAQTAELTRGLDPDEVQPSASSGLRKQAVRGVITTMVGTCGEFVDHYDADDEEGLDLVGDVNESSVKEALKEGNVTISKEAGLTLAQSMIDYNKKNLAGLPAEQVATIASALEKAQAEINAGIQPSAEQLYQILVLVGEPGLRSQLDATEETIATLKQRLLQSLPEAERDRLSKDLNRTIQERESLKRVLINNKNNEVFHLLEDAQNGKMDPELVGLLNDKIAGITDPKGFFEIKPEDLDDKNSLASIIVKHFAIKKGIDTEHMEAWLSKFLREHGSDIAMMGIFALFQMMTTMIGDAARGAAH